MSTQINNNHNDRNDRNAEKIDKIDREVLVLKLAAESQENTLKEIKIILHQQSDILQNLQSIQGTLSNLGKKVDSLDQTFERRKTDTDTKNSTFSSFMERVNTGVKVTLFFFVLIQGTVGFFLKDNYDSYKTFQGTVQELKIENAVIKEKLRIHSLDKTVQTVIQQSK